MATKRHKKRKKIISRKAAKTQRLKKKPLMKRKRILTPSRGEEKILIATKRAQKKKKIAKPRGADRLCFLSQILRLASVLQMRLPAALKRLRRRQEAERV